MGMPGSIHLSERAVATAREYMWTLLPGSSVVLPGSDLSPDRRKRGVRELQEKGMAALDELGCFLPPAPRVRFLEAALNQGNFSEDQLSWLLPDGLGNVVIYDYGKLEMVNAVALLYATGDWSLWQVHWYEHQPMIAVAEYYHPTDYGSAYLVFCWATVMDNEREMCERLEAMREALEEQTPVPVDSFWPAGIVILGASQWAVARALRLARALLSGWVAPGSIGGWYHTNGGWYVSDAVSAVTGVAPEGIPPMLPPLYHLRPSVSTRKLGRKKLKGVIGDSLWAGRQGQKLCELLTSVGMYPVGSVSQYQWLIGEHPKGKEIWKRMKVLEKRGLVEVVTEHGRAWGSKRWPKHLPFILSERGQGAARFALTRYGRAWFCYAHGGSPEDLFRRTRLGRRWTIVREKVVVQLLTLSWAAHLLYSPGIGPADLSDLAEVADKWKERRRGALVYLLTLASIVHLFHVSGQKPVQLPSLAGLERFWKGLRVAVIEDRWLYHHEDIVYDVLGQVRAGGGSFAPGWMGWTTLADRRRIEPDGMVLVGTPWGRLWCRLEVELSDMSYRAVWPRCDKYGSSNRRDDLPVLVVCRDERAEMNFHLAADDSEVPPRMLTTTLDRLKKGGVFGHAVWSDYGTRTTLTP